MNLLANCPPASARAMFVFRRLDGLASSATGWCARRRASASPASCRQSPRDHPALPDPGFSIIRVFGALALVLALFLAGVWLFKNWHQLAGRRARVQNLQVLESRSLGGRHALYVVGYQGQRLLLASSPAGVALLSHLPAAVPSEPESDKTRSENFVQVLQQAIQQKP